MKRTIAEMKADLAGEQPTRIGQMLTDQVVACWLETKFLETTAADPGKGSLEQAAFRLKRLESAQRRYLHAVTALSNVRRLVPAGTAPTPPIRLYEPNEQAV